MISIIVPARNGADMTQNCLRSALHALQQLQLTAQFVLIDDASEPAENMLAMFRGMRDLAAGHRVVIARAASRLHYTGVFASGIALADQDNVMFLSNDMVMTPHFLMALLGVAALDRTFGIVRGTSNLVDSHPEHSIEPPAPLTGFADVLRFSAERFAAQGLAHVEDWILSGDAILVKRAVIDRIGNLDCRFFGYFGDIDFGMRAGLAGFKLVCAKGAWLHHLGGGHIRIEAAKRQAEVAAIMPERMALVEAAYREFRAKWDPTMPADMAGAYAADRLSDYNGIARRNAARVDLSCALPDAIRAALTVE